MAKERRRRTTLEERTSPCEICCWPLTHRHHVFDFCEWGDKNDCWFLCSNCHEILHLAFNALLKKTKRSIEVWEKLKLNLGENHPTIIKILQRVNATLEIKWENYFDEYI